MTSYSPQVKEVARALKALGIPEPGSVSRLWVEDGPRAWRALPGDYSNPFALAAAALEADNGTSWGVFCSLDPLPKGAGAVTGDAVWDLDKMGAGRRTRLLVDIDPRDQSKPPADGQQPVLTRGRAIAAWLGGLGWPEPQVLGSGHGVQLLYRLNLPNNPESEWLIRRACEALAFFHDDGEAFIDVSLFGYVLFLRVPGTSNRKRVRPGEPAPRAALLESPVGGAKVVPAALLRRLSASVPDWGPLDIRGPWKLPDRGEPLDPEAWRQEIQPLIARHRNWYGLNRWILDPCPFDAKHTGGFAYLVRLRDGSLSAGCLGPGCEGIRWRDMRPRLGMRQTGDRPVPDRGTLAGLGAGREGGHE